VSNKDKNEFLNRNHIIKKLDEGDYATVNTVDMLVIERKTLGDLYSTIIQNHIRFKKEILRSEKKLKDFSWLVGVTVQNLEEIIILILQLKLRKIR